MALFLAHFKCVLPIVILLNVAQMNVILPNVVAPLFSFYVRNKITIYDEGKMIRQKTNRKIHKK